jgi:hypothetical protein
MARTGTFMGFYFDPEVFSSYMQEQSYLKTAIIASGIVVHDPTIQDLIGSQGNVGTMPFYLPIDIEATNMAPLNHDGMTDNVPVEVSAGKQTFMCMWRMKAFKETTFRTDLAGASGLQDVAGKVGDYYRQVWQGELVNILQAVVQVAGMENHRTNLFIPAGSSADANLISETTVITASQKALGDMADRMSLVIMHSLPYSRLQKLGLVEYNKFTIAGTIMQSVELPTLNGRIVVVDDRGTIGTPSGATAPRYATYVVGRGAFLGSPRSVDTPYYEDYDPEKNGGVKALYTKQGRVLHPNGFSLAVDNISRESPTLAELGTVTNWSLRFNPKNIPIAVVYTNG